MAILMPKQLVKMLSLDVDPLDAVFEILSDTASSSNVRRFSQDSTTNPFGSYLSINLQ